MRYPAEAKMLWESVPDDGQAATVEAELIRCNVRLRSEAYRNGNGNWDQGFERMIDYLESKLLDPAVFDAAALAETQAFLNRLRDHRDPCFDRERFDALADRTVEYWRHCGSQPHIHNPDLHR